MLILKQPKKTAARSRAAHVPKSNAEWGYWTVVIKPKRSNNINRNRDVYMHTLDPNLTRAKTHFCFFSFFVHPNTHYFYRHSFHVRPSPPVPPAGKNG